MKTILIILITLMSVVSFGQIKYTKDATNKEFTGNVKLSATKTKVGSTTVTENKVKQWDTAYTKIGDTSRLVDVLPDLLADIPIDSIKYSTDAVGNFYINPTTKTAYYRIANYWYEIPKGDSTEIAVELITNGDFASATGWNMGAGTSVTDGVAVMNVTGYLGFNQDVAISISKNYILEFDLVYTSGNLGVSCGGETNAYNISGHISWGFTTDALDALVFYGNGDFVGTIDNVTLKREL